MCSKMGIVGVVYLLALSILLSGAAAKEEMENLVSNPDFEAGTAGWRLGGLDAGAVAQMSVDKNGLIDDCLFIKIDAFGDAGYKPEIHSSNFGVEAGEVYTLAVWAKTEEGITRQLNIAFEQDHDPWDGPGQTFMISDEWTEYHHSPVMPFTDANMMIHIGTQQQLGDVWLDHFRVYQGEYVEEDLEELPHDISVSAIDTLTTAWGKIKSR